MKSGSSSLCTEFLARSSWISCLLAAVVVVGANSALADDPPAERPGPALLGPSAEGPSSAADATDQGENPTVTQETGQDATAQADEEETPAEEQPPKEPEVVGERLAPGIVKLVQDEIVAGLKRRSIESRFTRFRSYAGAKLNATNKRYTGSELTGNCRLDWYDHLLRNPISAPAEAEKFTRTLHLAAKSDHEGFARVLTLAAEKLDLKGHQAATFDAVASPEEALEVVKRALTEAQLAYSAALAPLSKSEIRTLTSSLYPILTSQNRVGHTLQSRGSGRRLCDLMEKIDRNAMHDAAEALVPITDRRLLDQLESLSFEQPVTVSGVTGTVAGRIDTPCGAIVVGGKEKNSYQLDKMADVSVVIDLGGDDAYFDGTVSPRRPVLIVIDLDGNDGYRGSKPGVQGAGLMGVSMLLDLTGNDVYQAKDVAQGSCLAGAGILIDYAGNDTYVGVRRVQGEAIGGVGILIDRAGNDRYHAAMWAQGFGGPLGFGLLDDVDGADHYYGGGLYLNSYLDDENPTPGYEGWSQGVGAGLRAVSNGGIGVILDGGGDDVYEYDYLSHGGGYWCGTGFARDFGGHDQRLGATRKAYNGGSRTQRRFVRFSNGFGCHYALGFLFDDAGNDTYNGTIMSVGFAWDCAAGYLFDYAGNDRYSGTEGNAAQAGLGVLFDYDGDDVYLGSRQGRASAGISYHDLPRCGGNFSFVIDYGGTDKYGCGAKNNSYLRRSSNGGFLIDRPKQQPAAQTANKPKAQTTAEK